MQNKDKKIKNHPIPNSRLARLQNDQNLDNNTQSEDNREVHSQLSSISQAPLDAATTTAVGTRQRRRWTVEINEYLLRTYLEITDLENNKTLYRKRQHQIFFEKYPLMYTNEQDLSNQLRAIHRCNLIPEPRRQQIREEVTNKLEHQNEDEVCEEAKEVEEAVELPVTTIELQATTIDVLSSENSEPVDISDETIYKVNDNGRGVTNYYVFGS